MKILLLGILLTSLNAGASEIDVVVTNLLNNRGEVYIGLYNESENFSVVAKSYRAKILKADRKNLTYKFKNIPEATYAIAVFHDENSNNKLDKSFLGMPLEGYGFSNNIRPMFRAANFEESKFIVDGDKTILINMGY